MAMGYLINKSGNGKALDFLEGGLKPETWATRNVTWTSPYHAAADDRNLQLTKMAIMGLALSGHPSAMEALRSLQRAPTTDVERRFQAQVSDIVSEALSAHEEISKEGLPSYYRKANP